MKIVLFKAFQDNYRQSMAVYAERLRETLAKQVRPPDTVEDYLPPGVHLQPRFSRWWSQYVYYQWLAPSAQGDINHVVDHAYAHLLHSLDPRRTVVTFHDAIAWQQSNPLLKKINLSGIRKTAWVICPSEASRRELLALSDRPADRTTVIYEGVDESFFQAPVENPANRLGLPPGRYLLHVGHTRSYKNIPALFHVLSMLVSSGNRELMLLKVGEAFTVEQERLMENLGIRQRVIHLGRLSGEKLRQAYRAADLLLHPSWDEGFGLTVLEAMASGLPIVASNRGSLPEVVGEAGFLVDPADRQALAQAATSVLGHPSLRAKLSAAGVERARQFTWDQTARQVLDVYRQVHR